jgi:hypothetical protein
MKPFLKIFFASLIFSQLTVAQEVSKLTLPSSPAFSILNFEPSAVMRPTNAKSLSTDVLSSFDKDGKLKMDLGLETSPYWLGAHPNLKMNTYLNPKTGQTILQSFRLSAATVKDTISGKNKFGLGFRFKLYNGKPVINENTAINTRNLKIRSTINSIINGFASTVESGTTREEVFDKIEEALKKKEISQPAIDELKKMGNKILNDFPEVDSNVSEFLNRLVETSVDQYKDLQTEVSKRLYDRKGLIVEFAGATGYNSDDSKFERFGFWGNASHFVSPDDFFTLTARYMHQNNDTSLTNVDIGLGFMKKSTSYNVSIEGMFRWYRAAIPDLNSGGQPITRLDKDFTYRLAVQGTYVVSKDISVNLSVGKDFNSPFISSSGVFSILGLSYNLFSKLPPQLPSK